MIQMNFHLEMEPELMTEWETNILCETPPGRIQIEVGVQSTYKKTLDAINRYNDWPYIQNLYALLFKRDVRMFIWILS